MNQEPLLTPTEVKFILWTVVTLFTILIAVFSFSGKLMIGYLKSMAASMNKMEKDLSVLANDHSNLKEDHIELKERVYDLEQKVK